MNSYLLQLFQTEFKRKTLEKRMNSGYRSTPFTALQWQELEQQALIFKYMMSGIPVPAELLLPIRKIGYYSMFGKKVDPEPGRCRRTDGKKWRCSKDAYPDSKYCERHMHRGRNRSRKPVETQNISQSSSTVTSLDSSGSRNAESFQNLPLLSIGSGASCSELDSSHLQTESNAYVMGGKDFSRYFPGQKPDADEHNFFSYSSGSERMLGLNSSVENPWLLMQSRVNSFPTSKQRNDSVFETNYPQLGMIQNVEQDTIISAIYKQQQHNLFGSEFGSVETEKAGQALRSFLDEWPKTRSSWSDIEDDRTNRSCSSTTQLSISIPISSSDFSASSSRSPNGK